MISDTKNLKYSWDKYSESWAESRNRKEPSPYWRARMREAFYAGAEACLDHPGNPNEIQAEIDHFRKQK